MPPLREEQNELKVRTGVRIPGGPGVSLRPAPLLEQSVAQVAQPRRMQLLVSQTLAAANLDFINLIEVVDESAATAVLERLNALVALSAFLGGERIGEPGWGSERDGAEDAHTAG